MTTCLESLESREVFAVKGSIVNYGRDMDDVLNIESSTLMFFRRGFSSSKQERKFRVRISNTKSPNLDAVSFVEPRNFRI